MKLMRIERYTHLRYTEDSRPSPGTVVRWIKEGLLPGRKLGHCYFVDIDKEQRMTGNPLVDRVLL
jgi:hypothetical protein